MSYGLNFTLKYNKLCLLIDNQIVEKSYTTKLFYLYPELTLNNSLPSEGLLMMDKIIDQECLLSFITEVELLCWNPTNAEDMEIYVDFVNKSFIYYVDEKIIKETIRIRKTFHLKIPDAFIAATALVHKLILVADNDKDFSKIDSLKYINPNHLSPSNLK